MGNMKFDGADVTFELDGYDALVERVRSKKVNCKINPSDLPRLYAVMDAELEGNEELAAAFAEAQEAAFGEAVLTVWAERIKSFKDSFIPVFGEACKDAACRFGFSKDGNNTFLKAAGSMSRAPKPRFTRVTRTFPRPPNWTRARARNRMSWVSALRVTLANAT